MSRAPHIVVLGNEKGGSGKSTTAMHVVVACLDAGLKVGVLDLDGRQKSLTRYLENRADFIAATGAPLSMPAFEALMAASHEQRSAAEAEDIAHFGAALGRVGRGRDIVVIDCPGSNSYLGRIGHVHADTLVTPINDSFVDFDLLGRVDANDYHVKSPSFYAEMVWEVRKVRGQQGGSPIDWVVMRNRLSHLDAHNKRRVEGALAELSRRAGFRPIVGLSERVVYRELFVKGLTLLDLGIEKTGEAMTMSHVAARQELRELMLSLRLPGFAEEARLAASA